MLTRETIRPSHIARVTLAALLSTIFSAAIVSAIGPNAHAFNAGKIMDDAVFTNASTMNAAQIQAFLNSKVTTCDTTGSQPSEYGGGTRAQWAQAKYGQSTFICLKDYSEGGRSAAQIIYDTAIRYQINPQVLIVLLQKEQGLITDTWPLNIQYRTATGYGCPDTAPCEAQYFGLTNQLDWSGKMFRAIMNASPTWYTPYILGNNYIRYNPNASCGGTNVTIQNRSTQALYNYTPYQPNAAALAAPMGTTVHCGAYGNLNFLRYFNSWFGSTYVVYIPGCAEATNTNVACVWNVTTPLNENIYTVSYDDLVQKVGAGAQYQNGYFLGINPLAANPGNIPVYKLLAPSGSTFLTIDSNERNVLVNSYGYTDQGISFYVDPPSSNSGYPVFRLYNSNTHSHVWTADYNHKMLLLNSGYSDEGIAFMAMSAYRREQAAPVGKQLVYRFYITATASHFWTTSVLERDSLIRSGYQYEGVGWYGTTSGDGQPVYRLYSPILKKHIYTTDSNERLVLSQNNWYDEGVSFYTSPSGTPVYRLYSPNLRSHLYTTDSNERNVLSGTGLWRAEGTAWYQ
jgi:hypothetical protein